MIIVRNYIFCLSISLLIFGIVGCQVSDNNVGESIPRIETETYPLTNEVVAYDDVPKPLQLWIEANELPETELVKAFMLEGETYIVVLLSEKDSQNYDVQITQVYNQITIRDNERSNPVPSAIYELKDISTINNTVQMNSHLAIVKVDEQTSDRILLQRSLSPDELSADQQSNESHAKQTNNKKVKTAVASGGEIAHSIIVEELTKEGKIKE